jgi:hypothetical protein
VIINRRRKNLPFKDEAMIQSARIRGALAPGEKLEG